MNDKLYNVIREIIMIMKCLVLKGGLYIITIIFVFSHNVKVFYNITTLIITIQLQLRPQF